MMAKSHPVNSLTTARGKQALEDQTLDWVSRDTGGCGLPAPLSLPCLSPTGETFLPYYTGRAIDSIVIQKSMDQFTTAVVVVCLLAIGR